MRYLPNRNRKKIFSDRWWILALAVFSISSILILRNEKANYLASGRLEISDGTEYRYLLERETIDEGKIKETLEKYRDHQFPEDFRSMDIKDYFLMQNITQVYGMTLEDTGESFYNHREGIIKDHYGNIGLKNIDSLAMGYSEGWKIIGENFHKQLYVLWIFLSMILLPIYNEDRRFRTEELIQSTEHGKKALEKIRVRNAYEIMTILYFLSVAIYLFLIFMVYGLEGYDLMIQNSPKYFLSPVHMNHLTVFLHQLFYGLIVTFFVGNLFLWISKGIEDVKTGYAILMGFVVVDYGLGFVSSKGDFNFISMLSPIMAVQVENFLLGGHRIMGISHFLWIPMIFLLITVISTILLLKTRRSYQ